MNKKRIFISSTMNDLEREREAVATAIDNFSALESVRAESVPARNETPRELCLGLVRDCDIYVGIFKNRYGYVPKENNPEKNSVVVLEYKEAKKNGIPILIFIYGNAENREEALKRFLEEITDFSRGHWRKEYFDMVDLTGKVIDAIVTTISNGYTINRENKKKSVYDLPFFVDIQRRLDEVR